MIYKSILLILGYLYGTMLTATFVVKHSTGNDVSKIGSGNPGMANVMEHIGKKEGVLVLAGDILKVIVAGILGRLLFPDKTWHDIFLYTGFGAIFGHNYPLWRKGKGGKGVTVTCTWLILTFGVPGAICCIIGGMVVLLTGWLPLGAVVIPALAIPTVYFIHGNSIELVCVLISTVLMLIRHRKGIYRIIHGEEPLYLKIKKDK